MNDLIELREKVQITVSNNHNNEPHSSTKYTVLPSSSDASNITSDKVNPKINPSRWNTLEFYCYYLVFIICVPMMFKIAIDLSKDSHPNYPLYARRLQKGWIFGRKVDNSDAQFASLRNNYPILTIALVGYLTLSHIYRLLFIPKPPIKQPSQHLRRAYFFLGFALIFLLIAAVLCMELMLHYVYVVAISQSRAWIGYTPAQLSMIGYFNLKLIWLKLLIIWRFFRFWAMADGIEVYENMTRCMSNNYSPQGFWRSWHRSFNLWNIRYIYIPLGGSKHQTINILIVFTFVALWHDISLRLLAWSWLIWLFILPENFAQTIFSAKKWNESPYYRHICAAGGVFNILMMMFANLVGFSVGLDGIKDLLTQIFLTVDAIFVAVQVMFEIREEEARRNIHTKGRD
ncbi:1794_t:CDS:2 [Ambispora gerdemannii]|uniref:1794_t:CDS:1 n=1 Tax=Ambispora gerdemannii TaxID=144530 RepID=A0A9N8V665_9GLOM|nr:1794_t:CDS:2 [Ambispora gerdemannii]